ncbi:MAG: hypothetical protein Q4F00_10415 [bacterium]|nr:hypothetical protein [bacterium]
MRLKNICVLSVFACSLLISPSWARPVDAFGEVPESEPFMLASADSRALRANKEKKALGVAPHEVAGNVADIRMASQWMAAAYQIPARVPEEMLLAGHSYGDVLVALNLMDYGASLNQVLEKRRYKRWPDVAESVGIGVSELPGVIQAVMVKKYSDEQPQPLRFYPDVRSGLSERLRLPFAAPTIPDSVAVVQFRLSPEEVQDVRQVLAHPNEATPEMLLKSAGRSLVVADWLIAATLAKYNPNPLETMLMMRTGEVVEWGDIASTFSIDPRIFVTGSLAPAYAVLTGTYQNAVVPSLKRPYYPENASDIYDLSKIEGEQREALRWLMSLYYKENTAERDLLSAQGYNLRDEALCLAISRLAQLDVQEVIRRHSEGRSWAQMVSDYSLDLTGEDIFKAVCGIS